MTRSKPRGEIGFLSDIRRMNVGMTPRTAQAAAGGRFVHAVQASFFGELLAYMKGVGGYRKAHEMVKQT